MAVQYATVMFSFMGNFQTVFQSGGTTCITASNTLTSICSPAIGAGIALDVTIVLGMQ
jgi:hypothetical protein